MIKLVILSVLFRAAFSACPLIIRAYEEGFRKFEIIGKTDEDLISHGAIVADDGIGNFFFGQPPYSEVESNNFNRTITCILSEQKLCSGIKDASILRKTLDQHSNCLRADQQCSTIPIESCPKDSLFRSVTGACNNKENPKWGKALTPYGRFEPASFSDGIYEIRKSFIQNNDLPEARKICNEAINRNPFTCPPQFSANHGSVMYGQLMAHDHGMRQMIQTQDGGPTRSCCNKDHTKPLTRQPFGCHPFKYTKDDPILAKIAPNSNIQCMNFIRSQLIFPNDCKLAPAQPVNFVTHYLDLSPVYGSSESVIKALRSRRDGLLKNDANKVLPRTCNDPNEDCYLTGDMRGTAFFTLGVLQSIYHRLHNIIATKLKILNPQWEDDRLFQEAKRINIAIYQNNVYTEWLRVFVGDEETRGFRPIKNEHLGSYRKDIDASTTVELNHCVFRIFHSNLNDEFKLIDANNTVTQTMALDECDAGLQILETKYNEVVRGMVQVPAAHSTYSAQVRNRMFNNNNKFNLGIDLMSTDLFIGRDLGVQPYYIYFQICTGKEAKSWDDFKLTIPSQSLEDLKKVYKSYKDVDSYAALSLEAKCGSYLGTVGKCIVVAQYERTRAGDRYFYSLPDGAYPFTTAQLDVIYKYTFANVLCTATDGIDEVPSSAFEIPSRANPMIKCSKASGIDLRAWVEPKA